ncbi:MAG: hypothetical protein E6J91_04855 [Deltaproteobacteria bacterium]|nr:MAG: hypothetical protein E6J91_04855 [Deltaproteobacteria bacterium]
MGVLAAVAAAALALAGCYSPSVRDCTVSCSSPGDCASGQVCGSDGLCAAPEVAGRCRQLVDAGVHGTRPPADPMRDAGIDGPDATATVVLHVQITGKGAVFVDGLGACSSKDPQRGDCLFDVAPGVSQIVHAIPIASDQPFAMWTSMTCGDQGARCEFTPVADTTIVARFVHSGIHSDGR